MHQFDNHSPSPYSYTVIRISPIDGKNIFFSPSKFKVGIENPNTDEVVNVILKIGRGIAMKPNFNLECDVF